MAVAKGIFSVPRHIESARLSILDNGQRDNAANTKAAALRSLELGITGRCAMPGVILSTNAP
jgi:hypothetical protein